jgi:hypothetical protein
MFLKNTSRYHIDAVRALITFAGQSFDLVDVAVNVKNCGGSYRGRAYSRVPDIANVHSRAKRLVIVAIGAPSKFPVSNMVTSRKWVRLAGPVPLATVAGASWNTREFWVNHRAMHSTRDDGVEMVTISKLIVERHPYGGKGSPEIIKNDWQEAMVAIAAHEFCHIHQYQNRLPRSEVQAEKVAARVLDTFRIERDRLGGRFV